MRRISAAALLCLASAAGTPAAAHPHVWIDATAELRMADGRVSAVVVEWAFDRMFSALLIGDFDVDADGRFDAAEQAALHDSAFADVADFGYFTHVTADGDPVAVGGAVDFGAALEEARVVYRFTLPLPAAVDARDRRVRVAFFDPEWYVAVDLAEGAVGLAGGAGCRVEQYRDDGNRIEFVENDMIDARSLGLDLAYGLPWTVALVCADS